MVASSMRIGMAWHVQSAVVQYCGYIVSMDVHYHTTPHQDAQYVGYIVVADLQLHCSALQMEMDGNKAYSQPTPYCASFFEMIRYSSPLRYGSFLTLLT